VGRRAREAFERWGLPVAISALILGGLYAVTKALSFWIALGVAAVVLLAMWRPSWRCATLVVLRVLGAILVAFLAMVGVALLLNLLVELIHHIHPFRHLKVPIVAGLIIATAAFALAAYWYLRRAGWGTKWSAPVAFGLAVLVVWAAPYVVGRLNSNTAPVAEAHPVPSQLDLLVVTDGSPHPKVAEPLPSRLLSEFDVTYSIGYAAGDQVRWTLLDDRDRDAALQALAEGSQRQPQNGQPTARPEADHVLLLYVDGTPPVVDDPASLPNLAGSKGEVAHWRGITRNVASQVGGRLPTFALLQTTAKNRLGRWKGFARPNGPVSVQALESQTATDAAVRLAVAAPTAQQDFALALQYRPILLFDKRETAPRPLSVTALFNEKRVRLCHDQGVARTTCGEPLPNAELLESGGTHLRLDLPEPEALRRLALEEGHETPSAAESTAETTKAAAATLPEGLPPSGNVPGAESVASQSAIYVHPSSMSREGKELLYLDYWWYLPYNPVKLGGGALCGAGLVIAGITCQDHESDWEGATVVIDRTGPVPQPVAVQYAQHSNVVRYSWPLLQEKWARNKEVQERVAGLSDASSRPLVFVAVGTHASYPLPCPDNCRQFPDPGLPEERHRGNLPWSGNDTSACGVSICLQELPTHDGGREPALWNGYDGSWGELHCFLTYYCDSGPPPQSPGNQGRYEHPTRFNGYAGSDWRFHAAPSAE
jgi:hypothetical protein